MCQQLEIYLANMQIFTNIRFRRFSSHWTSESSIWAAKSKPKEKKIESFEKHLKAWRNWKLARNQNCCRTTTARELRRKIRNLNKSICKLNFLNMFSAYRPTESIAVKSTFYRQIELECKKNFRLLMLKCMFSLQWLLFYDKLFRLVFHPCIHPMQTYLLFTIRRGRKLEGIVKNNLKIKM